MNTAMMAILSALSVAGVGTAAVAGTSMQMTGSGMHNGNGSMHGGTHGSMHGGGMGMHGDCPCCDFDDTSNDTAGSGQNQLTFGP